MRSKKLAKNTLGSGLAERRKAIQATKLVLKSNPITFNRHPASDKRTTVWDYVREPNGDICIHTYFHDGQTEADTAKERIVAIIAGSQSGKTSYGPLWLLARVIECGAGDYGVVTPTFSLLDRKALPEFRLLFQEVLGLGAYHEQKKKFTFSQDACDRLFGGGKCVVYFGYATQPDSLESATWKAAWLDEAGQATFKQDSYEAIRRRVALNRGRILITTTPYNLGWLKTEVWDPYQAGDKTIRVVRFDSTKNPAFSQEEMDEAKRRMPKWKFDQFYRGIFSRSAGVVYEAFVDQIGGTLCRTFTPPPHWRRVIGVDFGPVNFAAVYFAQSPETGRWFVYRTYYPAERRTNAEHIQSLFINEPTQHEDYSCIVTGGAPNEKAWRDKFAEEGLPIPRPAFPDLDPGIHAGHSLMALGRLKIMAGLTGLRKDLTEYSYVVTSSGDVVHNEIVDKRKWHRLDAFRYANVYISALPVDLDDDGVMNIDYVSDDEYEEYNYG